MAGADTGYQKTWALQGVGYMAVSQISEAAGLSMPPMIDYQGLGCCRGTGGPAGRGYSRVGSLFNTRLTSPSRHGDISFRPNQGEILDCVHNTE
jgi:hypothetical protein